MGKSAPKSVSAKAQPSLEKPSLSEEKVVESESETESGESSEVESNAGPEENESESGSSSEDDSESQESDDSDENEESGSKKQPSNIRSRKSDASGPQFSSVTRATIPFKLPEGFQIASISSTGSSIGFLKPSEFSGKQIWHIIAPSSISIKSLTDMTREQIRKGQSILVHNGAHYGFNVGDDGENRSTRVLVPKGTDNKYRIVNEGVARTLYLQQIIKPITGITDHNQSSGGSKISGATTKRPNKPARAQPKGLRMRYLPSGFGSGNPGGIGDESSSDYEEDNEEVGAPEFKVPKGLEDAQGSGPERANGVTETPKKRHRRTEDGPESEKKKHKNTDGGKSGKEKHSKKDKNAKKEKSDQKKHKASLVDVMEID